MNQDLEEYVRQGLKGDEILGFVSKKSPFYAWSLVSARYPNKFPRAFISSCTDYSRSSSCFIVGVLYIRELQMTTKSRQTPSIKWRLSGNKTQNIIPFQPLSHILLNPGSVLCLLSMYHSLFVPPCWHESQRPGVYLSQSIRQSKGMTVLF